MKGEAEVEKLIASDKIDQYDSVPWIEDYN